MMSWITSTPEIQWERIASDVRGYLRMSEDELYQRAFSSFFLNDEEAHFFIEEVSQYGKGNLFERGAFILRFPEGKPQWILDLLPAVLEYAAAERRIWEALRRVFHEKDERAFRYFWEERKAFYGATDVPYSMAWKNIKKRI